MIKIDRKNVEAVFKSYTDSYDSSDEKIRLKIEHTYKVAAIAEEIATKENFSSHEIELSWLLGMLHDVGRFEQVKRYGTFSDAVSIDHANFGADLLFKENLIERFLPEENLEDEDLRLCELAIRNHSVYRLPEDLTDIELKLCTVLRDADKIDILRVNVETSMEEIYNTTTEELKAALITPEVLQSFDEGHAVLRALKKTSIDNLVGHASLVFELVYETSKLITKRQGFIWKLVSFESNNVTTKENIEHMRKKLREYFA